MPFVRICGPADVFDFRSEDEHGDALLVTDPDVLRTLDGLGDSDVFSKYLADGDEYCSLVSAGVSGGCLRFAFDASHRQLVAITEYSVARTLSPEELESLRQYTIGQWSDGIGSNFFQNRMDHGLAPQMFYVDDKVVLIEQRS